MTMESTLSPSVLINGQTVHPEGWMYVMAFAIAGIPWAEELVADERYDMQGKVLDYNKRRQIYHLETEISMVETKLDLLKAKLATLTNGDDT